MEHKSSCPGNRPGEPVIGATGQVPCAKVLCPCLAPRRVHSWGALKIVSLQFALWSLQSFRQCETMLISVFSGSRRKIQEATRQAWLMKTHCHCCCLCLQPRPIKSISCPPKAPSALQQKEFSEERTDIRKWRDSGKRKERKLKLWVWISSCWVGVFHTWQN